MDLYYHFDTQILSADGPKSKMFVLKMRHIRLTSLKSLSQLIFIFQFSQEGWGWWSGKNLNENNI